MENFESLVISLLDSDARKGLFKKELANLLNIPVVYIDDIWLKTNLIDGVATQDVYVSFHNVFIDKDNLMKLPFKCIYKNCIVFEVGDTVL